MNPSTRRAYSGARERLRRWLDGRPLDDAALAGYIGWLQARGRAHPSATAVVSAVRHYARAEGSTSAAGPLTDAAVRRFRREARDRGRGQARGLTVEDVDAILDTAHRRRRYPESRRVESAARAARRGPEDAAIVSVLFQGGLRRSEAAALRWRDVSREPDGGVLIRVRRSKTNPGGRPDTRYLKGRCARAAPVQAVMLAGNWKSPEMVAHYSAAVRAARGAVAKYL